MDLFKSFNIPHLAPLPDALKLLDTLLPGTYGSSYLIGGGYARDLAYKVTPKDMDVVIQFSPDTVSYVLTQLETLGIPFTCFGAWYGDGPIDARAETVIKLTQDYIDIIFTHDAPLTAIGKFDFNFNQCFIDTSFGVSVMWLNFKPTELICIVDDISDERRAYMQAKWEQLNGSV